MVDTWPGAGRRAANRQPAAAPAGETEMTERDRTDSAPKLPVEADPDLTARLRALLGLRAVFFVGLPGTGKSLLIQQLAHLAHAAGRALQLLQWDVARPVFEACPAARPYPQADGVTHPIIRRAAGLWARAAVGRWAREHASPQALLLGEVPLVGHRFVELASPAADEAEPLLGATTSRFVVVVPSADLRRRLEQERERRARQPRHVREREDAPPAVLRRLWEAVRDAARGLGLLAAGEGPANYDPELYRQVFQRVLRHRAVEVLATERLLPVGGRSAYDLDLPRHDLVPTPEEAAAWIHEVERRYPDPALLEREVADWWRLGAA